MINLTETSQEEMELIQVGRGSTTQVEYTIDTPGSCIRWVCIHTYVWDLDKVYIRIIRQALVFFMATICKAASPIRWGLWVVFHC